MKTTLTTWYTANSNALDAFLIRRVNIVVNGEVTPQLSYAIMFDPSKTLALPTVSASAPGGPFQVSSGGDGKILQDAYIGAKFAGGVTTRFGQFRPPLSAAAMESGYKQPLARRPLFLESNSFGYYRDVGFQANVPVLPWLSATVGVFNGATTNQPESNEAKDVIGRLEFAPGPQFKTGLSYLRGVRGTALTFAERLGANAEWNAGPMQLRAEALSGTDGATNKLGWYGQGAYYLTPSVRTVLRYEEWDANLSAAGAQQNTTLGLNWYFSGFSMAGLNLIHENHTGPGAHTNDTALFIWQLVM
ncbi:Phosphate-selective porin O and P [compost metagenome]